MDNERVNIRSRNFDFYISTKQISKFEPIQSDKYDNKKKDLLESSIVIKIEQNILEF